MTKKLAPMHPGEVLRARRPPDKNTRLSNGVAFRFREVRAGAFKRVVVGPIGPHISLHYE